MQLAQVLVPNNEQGCVFCYTTVHTTTCCRSHICCLTARERKRTGKNENFAEQFPIRIAKTPYRLRHLRIDRLFDTGKPLFDSYSCISDGPQ